MEGTRVSDDQNKLYTDFKGRDVLDGISADNFDSLKDDAFITPENKKFFEDLLRVGWLSGQLSSSGPIPNTSQVIQTVCDTSNGDETIYSPKAGEVWQVVGVGLLMTAGVQSGTAYLKIEDATDVTNGAIIAEMGTSGSIESFDNDWPGPVYIDQNTKLIARYFKSGGFPVGDTVTYQTVLIRVR